MQTPSLGPAPNPEILNIGRNPAVQGGQSGTAAPENGQPSAPQGPAQPSAGGEPAAPAGQPAQTVQTGQAVQTGEAMPLPELPQLPQLPPEAIDLAELTAAGGAPRQDGNFQAFLQKLAGAPDFPEAMNRLLEAFQPSEQTVEATPELRNLLQMLPKDAPEMKTLLRQQVTGGTRFTGELFDALRETYAQSTSKSVKSDILQFLRRFSDYSSAPHIERSLVRTLGQLAKATPQETGETFSQLAEQLGQRLESGDRTGALKLLQGRILPFMTDFRDSHPDMRLPNTLISIFKPLAARYENSSEEGLLQAMRQLAEHAVLKPHFGKLGAEGLLRLAKEGEGEQGETRFADQLAESADWAMRGKGGGEPRKLARQLLNNVLLNKSVYLPLNHAIIPLEWDGKRLVSELWADPDAEKQPREQDEKERLIRFLFQMELPNLGRLDLVLTSQGESVDLQLACPEAVVPFTALIQREMGRILEDNGLKLHEIHVQKFEKPLTLPKVFPNLKKTDKNSLNLKV